MNLVICATPALVFGTKSYNFKTLSFKIYYRTNICLFVHNQPVYTEHTLSHGIIYPLFSGCWWVVGIMGRKVGKESTLFCLHTFKKPFNLEYFICWTIQLLTTQQSTLTSASAASITERASLGKNHFKRWLLVGARLPCDARKICNPVVFLQDKHKRVTNFNLNFAHHFVIYWLFQNGASKNQHQDSYQRKTVPDKFVFFSKLVRQKKVIRVSKICVCMRVRYVLKDFL